MKRNLAMPLFFVTCVLIGLLLLMKIVAPVASGTLFAIALVVFGVMSRGFTKH